MASCDMVFEGGGAKGSVFVGALEVFQARGHRHRRLIGTSAGAITATFLAAGYTPQEMKAAVNEKDAQGQPVFASFMDVPRAEEFTAEMREHSVTLGIFRQVKFPLLPNWAWLDRKILDALLLSPHYRQLFSLVECGGLFSGESFRRWLRRKLEDKGVPAGATLAEFRRLRPDEDLSLIASDVTDHEMLVLNHRTAPDLPLEWAVRMSMSIPFVWREVVWQESWGTYRGESKLKNKGGAAPGNVVVDGGVLSNFPIRLLAVDASDDPFVRDVMGGETVAAAAHNVGLLIDEEQPEALPAKPKKSLAGHLRTVQRVSHLVDTMTGASDNAAIRAYAAEICRLPAKGYGTTEFGMPDDRLQALIEFGRQAMTRHLGGRRELNGA